MKPISYNAKTARGLLYLILFITGVLIILLCSLVQHKAAPPKGEYFFSSFLRNNHTLLSNALFFAAGFSAGYYFKLHPWYSGMCFFFIFPLTSIIEAKVYKGSHNLIPFEFVVFFLMAIPTIIAVYIGRFVSRKVQNRSV